MKLTPQAACGPVTWSEADRLRALHDYDILDTKREAAFDDIVELASGIFDAPIAVVNFIADGRQWFKAEVGIGKRELPLDVSICRHAILQPGVFVVPDLAADTRFQGNPLVEAEGGLRFYAGALLETPDGLPLGTVCVLDTKPRPEGISERQRRALRALASQTMAQLNLRRTAAFAEEQRARAEAYNKRHTFLVQLSDTLRDLSHPTEITCAAAELLGKHLGVGRAGYGKINAAEQIVTVERDWTSGGMLSLAGEARILDAFGPEVIAKLRTGKTLVVEDCTTDSRTSDAAYLPTWASIGTRALIVVPHIVEGRFSAIMYAHAAEPRRWDELEIALAEDVARRTWLAVERAQAEAATRESDRQRRLLATVVEQSSDFIGIADAEGEHAFFVNEAGRRLVGLNSLEEVQRTGVLDYFAPEDQVFARDIILPTQEREGRWVGVFPFRHFKTGAKIPMFYNQFVIRDEQGTRIGVATVSRDITEQKAIQAALAEKAAEFEALAENVSQLAWMAEPDGHIFWYNKRWYEYTGTNLEGMQGWGWREVHHPDHIDRVIAEVQANWVRGVRWEGVYLLKGADGVFRPFLTRAEPILDEAGKLVRWFGTNTDISAQLEAEAKLRELNETLEQRVSEALAERKLWADVFASSDALIAALSPDYRFLALNKAYANEFERIFGARPDVGDSLENLLSSMPEHREAALAIWRRALSGEEFTVTEEFGDPDRARPYYELRFNPLLGKDGKIVGAFQYAVDVTERLRDQAELAQAQDALRQSQKMEAIGQLTGGVAHDFNNLLTIIRSSADLLRRRELTDEKRRRYVDAISDTADRAAKLTGQLLAFARRQALKPEVFDAGDRVRTIADMLRTVVGSRVQLDLDAPTEPCLIEADASQFETALVNLVVNARDAMEGSGRLDIRVHSVVGLPSLRGQPSLRGRFLSVRVTDIGHGIPDDKIDQIFEPFFTTKDVGKGTGLGLSQVYGFAKQSGGDVAVESQTGVGTTFTIYLPQADAAERGASNANVSRAERIDGGGHVLVVEDNEMVGAFATQLLNELGYETSWAPSAEAALQLLGDHPDLYDALFCDVVMPGMNGVDLAREIRRTHPDMPILLTSGYSDVLAQEQRHGFSLLQKPYSVEELGTLLRKTLRAR